MRWTTLQLFQHKNYAKLTGKDTVASADSGKTQNPVLERSSWDGALGTGETQNRNRQRFLVVVTSYRRTLLDEDNLCEKFHVDCCRYAGFVHTDAPGATRIETRQVKVGDKEDERTEIEISEINR